MNQANFNTTSLQLRTMRDALDRAGRTAINAEELAARTMRELQAERDRAKQILAALETASHRFENAENENRRLRNLLGGVLEKNNSLTTELKIVLRDARTGSSMDIPAPYVVGSLLHANVAA